MEQSGSLTKPTKRRRKHTLAFKREVVRACAQPGCSVASIAQTYQVNANLVHKWRREFQQQSVLPQADFIPLPVIAISTLSTLNAVEAKPVTVELPSPKGPVIIHWPADQIDHLAHWLHTVLA